MKEDPSINCWTLEGPHTSLVVISIFALTTMPLFVMSVILYAVINCDRLLGQGNTTFMQATGFIFKRY